MIHYKATSFPSLKTQHRYNWHISTTRHLALFSARCARSRGYWVYEHTPALVIITTTGVVTVPVRPGWTKPVHEGMEQNRKHKAEPVPAERSIREWSVPWRRMNPTASSFIQKENKEQRRTMEDTYMAFFKSSSFQSMFSKISKISLPLNVLWTLLLSTAVCFPLWY